MARRNYNKKGRSNIKRDYSASNSKQSYGSVGKYNQYNKNGSGPKTGLLVQNTSNFNWTVPAGTPVKSVYGQYLTTSNWKDQSFPTLMAFRVQPTIGISHNTGSPAHRLALSLYNDIVKINSTNAPYDPVDIEKYVLAMSQLSGYIEWVKRLYRIAGTYTEMNRTVPGMLLKANGVDGSDIRKFMSDFRREINLIIRAASVLKVPSGLPFFDEQDQLMANVYLDEDSAKAQMYMFVPDVFYAYDETEDPVDPSAYSGARLIPYPIWDVKNTYFPWNHFSKQFNSSTADIDNGDWTPRTNSMSARNVIDLGWSLVNPLLNSQDIYRLQADVSKTYGEGSMRQFTELEADETLTALYDPAMLRQIENLKITGHAKMYQANSSAQGRSIKGNYYPVFEEVPGINKGYLVFDYYPNCDFGMTLDSKVKGMISEATLESSAVYLLNSHKEIPSPEDAYELTRFLPTMDTDMVQYGEDQFWDVFCVNSCGLSLIVGAFIYHRVWKTDGNVVDSYIEYPWYVIPDGSESTINLARKFTAIDKFDWHPMIQFIGWSNTYSSKDILMDVDVFAEVPSMNVSATHEIRIINAFHAPGTQYSLN